MANLKGLGTIALLSIVVAATASCGAAPTPERVIVRETVPVVTIVRETVPVVTIVRETVPVVTIVRETVPVVTTVVVTATPLPTIEPQERRRVVFYDSGDDYSTAGQNTKIIAVAFANGIRLEAPGRQDEFTAELEKSDVAAAIYGSSYRGPSLSVLVKLAEFTKRGGRAFIMYSAQWSGSAQLLQDLFSVSIAREIVARGSILFPESMLPGFMKGLKVGMEGGDYCLAAYLVTVKQEGETGTVVSATSGKERTLYYSDPEGNVMFWPKVSESCPEGGRSMLEDYWFDQFQNEEAFVALLKHLVER